MATEFEYQTNSQPDPVEGQEEVSTFLVNELEGYYETHEEEVYKLLIEDVLKRREDGIEEYGTPLMTHNGRQALVDCYDEFLDALYYTGQMIMEEPKNLAAYHLHNLALAGCVIVRLELTDYQTVDLEVSK